MRTRRPRPITLAILLLCIFSTVGMAAPIEQAPGRGLTLYPCQKKANAACWRRAEQLQRFAPEIRVLADPIQADVRLAHDGARLLVRAMKLPKDMRLEIVVGPKDTNNLADTQVLTVGRGLHALHLTPPLKLGSLRAIRVHLRRDDDPVLRTWAPHGHGDLTRPGLALFTDSAPTDGAPRITVTREDTQLHLNAPGAAHLRIGHRRLALPKGSKGIPAPWSATGSDTLTVDVPPHTGWYDLRATWMDDAGQITANALSSIYLQAPGAPGAQTHGLHPRPQQLALRDEAPFVLRPDARWCTSVLDWLTVTKLAKREARRLTGVQPSDDCSGTTPSSKDVWWMRDATLKKDAFRLEVGESTGARIYASDKRGALYGGMALVDALGFDATIPALEATDWPSVEWRILFHKAASPGTARIPPAEYIRFIERAVSRGRYNMLVLHLENGFVYPSHPKLARPNAWSQKDLSSVINAARSLGMMVVPGMSTPGHSQWLTGRFPELKEDATGAQLCTRHPQTRVLVSELMTDLLEAFGQPAFIHIGHDEVWWRTERKHEIQRCPRCEGTPRWLLLAQDIQWQHDWLKARNVRPILWTDMLVKGWHGTNGAVFRASNRLPQAERADYLAISWTRKGNSIKALGAKGYRVVRGHTGYTDWKRAGLGPVVDQIAGEALALFYAAPWSSFWGQTGPLALYNNWPNVVLAGTTAWRPEMSDTPIDETLDALQELSAYTPGYRHQLPGGKALMLPKSTDTIDAILPAQATVNGVDFDTTAPQALVAGEQLSFNDVGEASTISFLQATQTSRETDLRLIKTQKRAATLDGPTVATMTVRWTDGKERQTQLRLGMDTERPERPTRGQMLWRTSGTFRVPSVAAGAISSEAKDRCFYRWDWINPRPEQAIERITWNVEKAGVRWHLLGATVSP
jgi:hypothetical protein